MAKKELPEAKEITIKLDLNEAKKCLEYLPEELKNVKDKIKESIEYVNFWNFLRNCSYLVAVKADFHLTGLLNPPAWSLYCTNPKNKIAYKISEIFTGSSKRSKRENSWILQEKKLSNL